VATELMEAITDKALEKYVERTGEMEALQAEDSANAIMFAVEATRHVNVNEILIRPMTQER
jgi:NADP-dependent 3-hydroxy acid dehydrogenase YdfG